jgi:hypothetical protein
VDSQDICSPVGLRNLLLHGKDKQGGLDPSAAKRHTQAEGAVRAQ